MLSGTYRMGFCVSHLSHDTCLCKCWESGSPLTYFPFPIPRPHPPTNRLVTALESGLMSILASAGHRWFSSKSRTSERVHHESRCIYCIYIYTCISSCLKKTCHFKGGSTGGHSQDKRSTKLQYYKWTWPLTMHPFKTIHENMTWDIFRNDNSWKCKLIPLRALGNQLNSLWDVLYLCLILVSVSVMFDLFLQQFYSPKMGPNAWPRTHTLPTPLFETPRDRPRSVFLPTPWTWRPLPEMGLIFFPGWDVNVNLVL